jgi:hypothetical protein
MTMDNDVEQPETEPLTIPDEIAPDPDAAPEARTETRTQVVVTGPGAVGQPLVDRVETTGVGGAGVEELVRINLTAAPGCNHVLHTGAEVGAVCACGCDRLLCTACATRPENLCSSCRRPVAGPCQIRSILDPTGTMRCWTCWQRQWASKISWAMLAALFAGVGLLILYGAALQLMSHLH